MTISPQALSQFSASFRKGYYDGYDGKPFQAESGGGTGYSLYEYSEGYKAGDNARRGIRGNRENIW